MINRDILNKNIQWYQPTPTGWHILNYNDFIGGITQWKNILFEQGQLTTGQKFGVGSSRCDYVYLTAILAGIELGGKVIVMPHNTVGKHLISPIQAWAFEDNNTKAITDGQAVGSKFAIPWSTFQSFKSRFDTFEHLDQYLPTTQDIVLLATTSGTSGSQQIQEYTHKLFDDVRKRSIKIFNLTENDRVLHLSNMHHGGTGGVFFLPSLNACQHHYYADGLNFDQLDEIIQLVKEQRITKAMFPNNLLVDKFLNKVGWLDHDFDIYVNQANSKSWVEKVKQTNVRSINSLFGSAETLGPIFLNTITRQTDISTYSPLNYGKLLDDHFSVELKSDCTVINIKNHYSKILKDLFIQDNNGNYIFQLRTNIIRIHDIQLPMSLLDKINSEILPDNNVAIVADSVTNKIYCAFDRSVTRVDELINLINEILGSFDPLLKIDHHAIIDLPSYVNGIKLNLEAIRDYFRTTYNLL